jgi:hypothetical protein
MPFRRRRGIESPVLRPDVIDLVALSPDGTTYGLSLIETRPWNGGEEQLRQVQTKLNAYATFILDGQLDEQYPDAPTKKKLIILQALEEPTGEALAFLEKAADIVAEDDITLEVWPLDE